MKVVSNELYGIQENVLPSVDNEWLLSTMSVPVVVWWKVKDEVGFYVGRWDFTTHKWYEDIEGQVIERVTHWQKMKEPE